MQHPLAAVRAGRPSTMYVRRPARARQRHLGLGSAQTTVRAPASVARRPLDALRTATRRHVIARATTRRITAAAARQLSWSRPFDTGLRRARPRSAAPWRA